MAVIVLAIGMVMAVAGGCEIFYGSGFIEIERGWSAFISGTVLLTGGLITVALGLTLRSLAALRGTIAGLSLPPAAPAAGDLHLPPREAPMALHPAEQPLALEGAAPAAGALQIEPFFGDAAKASAAPSGDPQRAAPEHLTPLFLADEPDGAEGHPPVSHPSAPFPSASELAAPAAEGAGRLQASRHPYGPDDAPADASPAMDDWLDRSFADLHGGGVEHDAADLRPQEALPPQQARHDEPALGHDADLALAGTPAAPFDEPDAAQAQRPAPAAASLAPAAPAVIGRYEADGTSYVMYADGSIEAHSEAGIYRFASMAELRAFIET